MIESHFLEALTLLRSLGELVKTSQKQSMTLSSTKLKTYCRPQWKSLHDTGSWSTVEQGGKNANLQQMSCGSCPPKFHLKNVELKILQNPEIRSRRARSADSKQLIVDP